MFQQLVRFFFERVGDGDATITLEEFHAWFPRVLEFKQVRMREECHFVLLCFCAGGSGRVR
jgi:hypothetical protein